MDTRHEFRSTSGEPDHGMLCALSRQVMRFHVLRAVRVMVLGLCVIGSTPLAAVWAASAPPSECHECCPDGLRPAPSDNCCIAAPAVPGAPEPARVTVAAGPTQVALLPAEPWALLAPADAPARTAPPPLLSSSILLRTTVLLI